MHLIEPYIIAYGAMALFVIIYLESFGVPMPGESAVIAASVLATRGDLSIAHVMVAVFVGAVLGDSTGYLIGRYGGRTILERFGPRVGLTAQRLAQMQALFRAKGPFIVATARFVAILRQLNGVVAGTLAMPWLHFVAANAIGAALWTAVWTLGPYFFTDWFMARR
ncbi:MAG: DedA family protein [Rhizobiales bacterium]|nr:DedA family protein [Hyphomicrobiales bacterium]